MPPVNSLKFVVIYAMSRQLRNQNPQHKSHHRNHSRKNTLPVSLSRVNSHEYYISRLSICKDLTPAKIGIGIQNSARYSQQCPHCKALRFLSFVLSIQITATQNQPIHLSLSKPKKRRSPAANPTKPACLLRPPRYCY